MGKVASAFDNAMIESFFGSMQIWPDPDRLIHGL